MVEGAHLNPIRIQVEGVAPDRVALHAIIVNIDDPISVDVDEGCITGFSGRGMGMTGHPEKDLGIGDQERVHPGLRLDDGIGTIDIVPESGLGPLKRRVGEDDGRLVAVPEELIAEPCQLRFADAGAKTIMIGGEKKEKVTADFQLVVVLLKAEGLPEFGQLRLLKNKGGTDIPPGRKWTRCLEVIVVVADNRGQGVAQVAEIGGGGGIFPLGAVPFGKVADGNNQGDIPPGIDPLQHRLLGGQIVTGQMRIAENNQVGGCTAASKGMPGSASGEDDEGEQNCDD